MTVTCPSCQTVYRIDPAKVPPGGVRARCAVCQGAFEVSAAAPATAAAPPPPPPPRPRPEPVAAAPAATPPPPVAPASSPERPAAAVAPPPPLPRPAVPRGGGMAPSARPSSPLGAGSASTGYAPAATAATAAAAAPPRGTAPVNPFLSQDPRQKARRLARALVSDIAVYHAERRREALRAGRLKEAFAEEIKKSWEEYTGQVGRDLAESTPFFTEALNEILAEGQPVF